MSTEPLLIVIISLIVVVFLIPYVFYLINLQDLLKEVSSENRQVPAVNVWLLMIPLFNIVYRFIIYPKISESLRLEFEQRGEPIDGDYGKGIGLTLAILNVVYIFPNESIRTAISLGLLVIWIVFWVKMGEFKKRLRHLPKEDGVHLSNNPDLLD